MIIGNDILKDKRRLAIVDGRADEEIIRNLERLNLKVLKTNHCKEVYDSISYHPDIVLHPIDSKTLLIAPNVFEYYERELKNTGISLIKGDGILGEKYPENILYNVGRIGNLAVHNTKYTDTKLKELLLKRDLSFLHIKQGYSKCSLGLIDEKIGITSDIPMYRSLIKEGYDMLLIEPGYIDLKGEKYGFIGGCMGNLNKDTILFTGNLEGHPSYERIIKFIEKYDKKIIYLSNKKIMDLGSIFILDMVRGEEIENH